MTAAEYKRVTEVTYLGYVYGTLSALKWMLPRDQGIIIQVGSALAYRGIPLQSAYSAAKHAVQGFTESVRCELIHDASQVKISMIPGNFGVHGDFDRSASNSSAQVWISRYRKWLFTLFAAFFLVYFSWLIFK